MNTGKNSRGVKRQLSAAVSYRKGIAAATEFLRFNVMEQGRRFG
jgi:hypothetical protein